MIDSRYKDFYSSYCITPLAVLFLFLASCQVNGQSEPCVFNATHCSCSHASSSGNCLRFASDGRCLVDKCGAGMTCDYAGTNLCTIRSCKGYLPSDGSKSSSYNVGELVACKLKSDLTCKTRIGELDAAAPSRMIEYRQVQFGTGSTEHMFNISAFEDLGETIKNNYNMHGKWRDAHRLEARFITVRFYRDVDSDDDFLCAIYNAYGIVPDNLGDMRASVSVEGTDGQTLEWVACDDALECHASAGAVLKADHVVDEHASDGWCVAPLAHDGTGVVVEFSDLNGFRGIRFQDPSGLQMDMPFSNGAEFGISGSVDGNGLVVNGKVSVRINLRGIAREV